MRIPVNVYLPTGNTQLGYLTYKEEGAIIETEEAQYDQSAKEFVTYSFQEQSIPCSQFGIDPQYRFNLKSNTIRKTILSAPEHHYDLYPPSSKGWVSLLSDTGTPMLFIVQEMTSQEKKIMTLVDIEQSKIVDCIIINPYESEFLFMKSDRDEYVRIFDYTQEGKKYSMISDLLNKPPPTWQGLESILNGVTVPNLEIKDTMEETMDQLVPISFQQNIRTELKAFLAWLQDAEIPKEDPLDFSNRITDTSIFASLVFGHIQCMLENKVPPDYVRILTMADRGLLKFPNLPIDESIEKDKWQIAWFKLRELLPNNRNRVLQLTDGLNQNETVHTSLPISRIQARNSREAWSDRFALINNSVIIRGFVQTQRIGLNTLVYVGGAHKWPHKHLSWTARLSSPKGKPPFIQVMVIPPTSTEQALRLLPNISKIGWTASAINLSQYDSRKQVWKSTFARISKSLVSNRTIKQLEREFPKSKPGPIILPSEDEVKVLDYISWQMYLSTLEKGGYESVLELSNTNVSEILNKYKEEGIMKIQYLLRIPGLIATCQIIEGESDKILSLVRSFLKYMPSTTAMVETGYRKAYVISRIPDDDVFDILVNLPNEASKYNIKVRNHRIDAYVGYQNNLYSRLLKSDGTWDDDISGLLSQSRS